MTRRPLVPFAIALFATGCHGKFKRAAPGLGSVRPVVHVDAPPTVERDGVSLSLGDEGGNPIEDVVELGTEIGTARQAAKVQRKLNKAVDAEEITVEALDGFNRGTGATHLPFKVSEEGKHPLHITVTAYGLTVAGGEPAVTSTMELELYRKRSGERVYRTTRTCTTAISESAASAIGFGGVDELLAMQQLAQLKPAQMERLVTDHVRQCAAQAGRKMGKHAG